MNNNDMENMTEEELIRELARRSRMRSQPTRSSSVGGGMTILILMLFGMIALFALMNNSSGIVIGLPTPDYTYDYGERETVIFPTDTPMLPPTTAYPTLTPVPTHIPIEQWAMPITKEQYDQCVSNPDINPACDYYLNK